MKKYSIGIFILVSTMFSFYNALFAAPQVQDVTREAMVEQSTHVRVPFIENKGQIENKAVAFYARMFGGMLYVEKNGILTYSLLSNDGKAVVFKEVLGEGKIKQVKGLEPAAVRVNCFKGKEKSRWKTKVPSYEKIFFKEIYEGINLTLKARGTSVEKIFTVLPEKSVASIRMKLIGAGNLTIGTGGELIVETAKGNVKFSRPAAYQDIGGKKKPVAIAYTLYKSDTYGFYVGKHDSSKPLIIDPLLESTLIGGSDFDFAWGLCRDSKGDVYVSSGTTSTDFPTTSGAYDETQNGDHDIFIAKLDNTLSTLLACTFIGGSAYEQTYMLTVDQVDNIYAVGYTRSSDFPTTSGAYDETFNGIDDLVVVKLDSSLGTLLASTVVGGSDVDQGHYIIPDEEGNLVICGLTSSVDFPTTAGAYDQSHNGSRDALVIKLDNSLHTLISSTFIGGDGTDGAYCIAFDTDCNVYVTGLGTPPNFPVTPGAYDDDGYVFAAKLDSDLGSLLASTTFGGNSGPGYGYTIALNNSGEVYVAGETKSINHPVTHGAYDESPNGTWDVFITKFNNNLDTIIASTYLGGSSQDWHHRSMFFDALGNVYVSGLTASIDFPTTPGSYQPTKPSAHGVMDIYITKFNSSLSDLIASTFLGGSNGNGSLYSLLDETEDVIYIIGWTRSADYPVTAGAYDTTLNGDVDVVVTKITSDLSAEPTLIDLAFFTATGYNGRVNLTWGTESEIDTMGFNIYRSESEDRNYKKINDDPILATGSALLGSSYGYTDDSVKNRRTYYYKIEDIDIYGKGTFHGPVSAVPRVIHGSVY